MMLSNRQRKQQQRQRKQIDPSKFPNQTAFRQAERRFRLGIDNDWSDVIDMMDPTKENRTVIPLTVGWDPREASLPIWQKELGWTGQDVFQEVKAFGIETIPGLIILPNLLSPKAQRYLVKRALKDYTQSPNRTNLDAHYKVPKCGPWNYAQSATEIDPELPSPDLLLKKLRWTTLGYQYDWSTKQYHPEHRFPMPEDLDELMKAIVQCVHLTKSNQGIIHEYPAEQFRSEAGVINFYKLKDTLTAHVDQSEKNMKAPLISISLGQACIYLIGSEDINQSPVPIYLRSGDVIVMTGPSRYAYHGVPLIIEHTLPDHMTSSNDDLSWQPFANYLASTRININVRQVF
jgi:alkylated DNA repair protein alkB family protein 1